MRALTAFGLVVVTACGSSSTSAPPPVAAAPPTPAPPRAPIQATPPEKFTADTPRTTTEGNHFVAPADWTLTVKGAATILSPPEDGNWIVLVDVHAPDADAALKLGWAAYKPEASWPLDVATTLSDREGWHNIHQYAYRVSPNERRDVAGSTRNAGGDAWTVILYDMQEAVGEKRGSQVATILGKLQPKGYEHETFAGRTAHELDAARLAALGKFVEDAEKELGVPGVSVGIVQNGKVVFAGGFGVRELGKPAKPDADTMFMIASNTKALTTLLLARLVDEHKLTWDTPVTQLFPSFKLGSADTTSRVLVKHLICACTGLPRQDLEWLFQFGGLTPEKALATLGTMEPTSKFGELFQYSNPMAAAAGFIAGHVEHPKLELGAAYDAAMQAEIFGPLGMTSTTFDYARAQRGNHASPHVKDVDGATTRAGMEVNYAAIPLRPAGAAWSNIHDMLRYVQMELDEGMVGGKRFVSADALLARRAPQVNVSKDETYGMGLMVDKTWGVPVVHHGGDLIGYHSDMMWIPDAKVGAVVLTNGAPGWIIRTQFRRKLLEVLYDGEALADATVASSAEAMNAQRAAERKQLAIPPDPDAVAKLAAGYGNAALGDIQVTKTAKEVIFDVGEWKSPVATKKNPDGTTSFVTLRPGIIGVELVVGEDKDKGKRTLTVRDGQHDYVFVEK